MYEDLAIGFGNRALEETLIVLASAIIIAVQPVGEISSSLGRGLSAVIPKT